VAEQHCLLGFQSTPLKVRKPDESPDTFLDSAGPVRAFFMEAGVGAAPVLSTLEEEIDAGLVTCPGLCRASGFRPALTDGGASGYVRKNNGLL
jgi:hypothetical protein